MPESERRAAAPGTVELQRDTAEGTHRTAGLYGTSEHAVAL